MKQETKDKLKKVAKIAGIAVLGAFAVFGAISSCAVIKSCSQGENSSSVVTTTPVRTIKKLDMAQREVIQSYYDVVKYQTNDPNEWRKGTYLGFPVIWSNGGWVPEYDTSFPVDNVYGESYWDEACFSYYGSGGPTWSMLAWNIGSTDFVVRDDDDYPLFEIVEDSLTQCHLAVPDDGVGFVFHLNTANNIGASSRYFYGIYVEDFEDSAFNSVHFNEMLKCFSPNGNAYNSRLWTLSVGSDPTTSNNVLHIYQGEYGITPRNFTYWCPSGMELGNGSLKVYIKPDAGYKIVSVADANGADLVGFSSMDNLGRFYPTRYNVNAKDDFFYPALIVNVAVGEDPDYQPSKPEDDDGSGQTAEVLTNGFALLGSAFSAWAGLFSYAIFPGLTLGVLFSIPLIVALIFFILKVIHK